MTNKPLQRIMEQAQKIAACEQEISELVRLIGLLDNQISNCRKVLQNLQHCPAEDGDRSPVEDRVIEEGESGAAQRPSARATCGCR